MREVLEHYARGGRAANPLKSDFITGFAMSAQEKEDLVAFLQSLTDYGFLRDPAFGDPGTSR